MTGLEAFGYFNSSHSTCELKRSVGPTANRLGGHSTRRHRAAVLLLPISLVGCARAPSFDILGSFFPAWLLCLAVGVLLSFAVRWLVSLLGIVLAVPVLTYPSLTFLFACAVWLAFFQ